MISMMWKALILAQGRKDSRHDWVDKLAFHPGNTLSLHQMPRQGIGPRFGFGHSPIGKEDGYPFGEGFAVFALGRFDTGLFALHKQPANVFDVRL